VQVRKLVITVGVLAAAAVPAFASSSTAQSDAQKQCRAERDSMGVQVFRATYGTNKTRKNAFGKCVSRRTSQNSKTEQKSHDNAVDQCRAEQQSLGDDAFNQKYAANSNGKNAFGKCVSQKARARTKSVESQQVQADENAAQQCKSERSDIGKDAFKAKYGTNKNKSNAFGKCVSQHAKAQEKQDGTQS
jgi:hypothetical protein